MPTWNTPKTRNLLNAVLQLKSQDEARRFFRDLLTAEELLEFSRRWQAAQLLNQKVPYTKIVKVTGLSSTTVAYASSAGCRASSVATDSCSIALATMLTLHHILA